MVKQPECQFQPPESQFTRVAEIYDELMDGIAYDVWLRYVKSLWRRRNASPKSVLDVACGTGNVSFRLAADGFRVVGVDYSEAMIEVAKRKQTRPKRAQIEPNPLFLCQNATQIELDVSFDCALCLFDSLNYILDYDQLEMAFKAVYKHLNPGGVFVFDMNTIYALKKNYFDQDNLDSGIYPLYEWKSSWNGDTQLCTIEMEFQALGEHAVEVFHETHRQRGYSQAEVGDALSAAGFEDIEFPEAFSTRPTRAKSDRMYVVTNRPTG